MNNLWKWFLGVWVQFTAGWILLGMRGGKEKYRTLFRKNIAAWTFVLFDALLVPILTMLWFIRGTAFTPLYHLLGALAALIVLQSTFLSIFDIPNFIPEQRHLDEAIRRLNPLRVFIAIPFHWIWSMWTKRRTP